MFIKIKPHLTIGSTGQGIALALFSLPLSPASQPERWRRQAQGGEAPPERR